MDTAWKPDNNGGVVGVVDREPTTNKALTDAVKSLESVLATHDATAVSGSAEEVLAADPSLLVAAGERSLSALTRAAVDTPTLPVGDVAGIESVSADHLLDAIEAVLAGHARMRPRPVLEVEVEGQTRRALFDATLVTAEPAKISEYGVRSGGDAVATFRADGVVVATPAGTRGYASAVDAPSLSAAVDGVAVTPIAPFVTQTRHWVLPDDEVVLTVERDEGDVMLVVDEHSVTTVSMGSPVRVGVDGTLPTLDVPAKAVSDQ